MVHFFFLSACQGRVLHNLMPIFTFMGASILRHDDQYSFQVIDKTLETIIPVLVKVREESVTCSFFKGLTLVGICRLIQSAIMLCPR